MKAGKAYFRWLGKARQLAGFAASEGAIGDQSADWPDWAWIAYYDGWNDGPRERLHEIIDRAYDRLQATAI